MFTDTSFCCGFPAVVCGFDYTAGSCLDFAIAAYGFSPATGVFPPVKAFAIVFDFPASACAAVASFFHTGGDAPGSAVFALRSSFSIFDTFAG